MPEPAPNQPVGIRPTESSLDLDRLLKLRLVVARVGEMDNARWWNTNGQLGRLGSMALSRGLPRTHAFAQARSVFAVASHRCREIFDPPHSATFWALPAEIEDEFENRWSHWVEDRAAWVPFFAQLAEVKTGEVVPTLEGFGLIQDRHREAFSRLRRSAANKAVPLPGLFRPDDETFTLLALGFGRGELGQLAVPYARLEE